MCKLIAVTIKLQLVRQPAGHKWEFQTARVFLLEKQHLHNMSLQLFEMKNQKGKLPPHTPDLKVSIWVADGLDRAKSTTQKNSSCLVIWHSTRANVGGFIVFYADWIWATLPPNRTASFYSFYTYLSLQPLFSYFLIFCIWKWTSVKRKQLQNRVAASWYKVFNNGNRNFEIFPLHTYSCISAAQPSFELAHWTHMNQNKSGKKKLL